MTIKSWPCVAYSRQICSWNWNRLRWDLSKLQALEERFHTFTFMESFYKFWWFCAAWGHAMTKLRDCERRKMDETEVEARNFPTSKSFSVTLSCILSIHFKMITSVVVRCTYFYYPRHHNDRFIPPFLAWPLWTRLHCGSISMPLW